MDTEAFPETTKYIMSACLNDDKFMVEFYRLTGAKPIEFPSPVEAAVDAACGYEPNKATLDRLREFIREVF